MSKLVSIISHTSAVIHTFSFYFTITDIQGYVTFYDDGEGIGFTDFGFSLVCVKAVWL